MLHVLEQKFGGGDLLYVVPVQKLTGSKSSSCRWELCQKEYLAAVAAAATELFPAFGGAS